MTVLLLVAMLGLAAVLWFALDAHLPVGLIRPLQGLVAVVVLAGLAAIWFGHAGAVWWGWAGAAAAFVIWYLTRIPRNDKAWIPEVAHGLTGRMGRNITIPHVRRFRWITKKEVVEAWEPWEVDPEAITSVDLIMSIWSSPLIAHTMVSFGFADGRHLVISGETRRQKGDRFTITGGFFRRFELILIAADERDVVHLRTDVRREKVSIFPVLMTPEARRALFLAFINHGNDLARKAAWYNTITSNCTTVPFEIVRTINRKLRYDWRLIFSGHLPGYLKKLGVLPPGTMDELRARAVLPVSGDDGTDDAAYSQRLRQAWRV
ncbi:MAG: DUF4105 domain-containing protein [Rhodobacteraceae bacterium]|nr:DUF4105 domain-containing protein [Paracoccaceae bacterium]